MSKRPRKQLYKSKNRDEPPPVRELPPPPPQPRAEMQSGPLDNPEDDCDDEESDYDTGAEFGA